MARKPTGKPVTHRHGPLSFTLRPVTRGWYFEYTDPAGGRRQLTLPTLEKARTRADAIGAALLSTRQEIESITPEELAEFRAWKAARQSTPTGPSLGDAITAFLASRQTNAGLSARYIPQLRYNLTALSTHFPAATPLAALTTADLQQWLAALPGSARNKKNHRVTLITFSRWARSTGHLPDTTTAAEKTTEIRVPAPPIGILTPDEFHLILTHALAHQPKWLPWLLLSGWAGLRTDELFRHAGSKKQSLHWEHLRLTDQRPEHPHGIIYIPANVAKQTTHGSGQPRYIPLTQHLHDWLQHLTTLTGPDGLPLHPKSGPIHPGLANPSKARWIPALTTLLNRPWPRNALRHSYGTYRCAILNETHRPAREMGNSETIIRRHYDRVTTASQASDYFHHPCPAITAPPATPKSPQIPTKNPRKSPQNRPSPKNPTGKTPAPQPQ